MALTVEEAIRTLDTMDLIVAILLHDKVSVCFGDKDNCSRDTCNECKYSTLCQTVTDAR